MAKTKVTTIPHVETTQVRSRVVTQDHVLDSVFDRVVELQQTKKELDAELKGLKVTLLDEVKNLGGEYIRNGVKAQVIAENLIPKGKLVTLKEVLKAVPKKYHYLILEDKKIAEYVKTVGVKE
jgi:hypothetical protein